MKKVAGSLRLDLAQYRETGRPLPSSVRIWTPSTQRQLTRGERMVEILKQGQYVPHGQREPADRDHFYAAIQGIHVDDRCRYRGRWPSWENRSSTAFMGAKFVQRRAARHRRERQARRADGFGSDRMPSKSSSLSRGTSIALFLAIAGSGGNPWREPEGQNTQQANRYGSQARSRSPRP